MIKKFYAISAAVLISLSAYCESIDELLSPIKAMEGTMYVNVLEQPAFIAEIQQDGGENAKIVKSLEKFEALVLSSSTTSMDTLAKQFEDKAGMGLIYDLSMQKSPDKLNNLFGRFVEQGLPLLDYVRMYALKSGDKYTDLIYLIHTPENVKPSNCGIICYVKGNMSREQLQYSLPKITTDSSISLNPPQ